MGGIVARNALTPRLLAALIIPFSPLLPSVPVIAVSSLVRSFP